MKFRWLIAFSLIGAPWVWAQDEVTNPDGTKSTTYTADSEAKQAAKDQAITQHGTDARDAAKKADNMFPEEKQKELQRQADRAKMTQDEKDREKRMLNHTPCTIKNINPGLTNRGGLSSRYQ